MEIFWTGSVLSPLTCSFGESRARDWAAGFRLSLVGVWKSTELFQIYTKKVKIFLKTCGDKFLKVIMLAEQNIC